MVNSREYFDNSSFGDFMVAPPDFGLSSRIADSSMKIADIFNSLKTAGLYGEAGMLGLEDRKFRDSLKARKATPLDYISSINSGLKLAGSIRSKARVEKYFKKVEDARGDQRKIDRINREYADVLGGF